MGAAALRCQVVLQFFYLLPVLLQLHLKLLYQATEIALTQKYKTDFQLCQIHKMMNAHVAETGKAVFQ